VSVSREQYRTGADATGGGRPREGRGPGVFARLAASWKSILLITGLTILSWISTYTGMLELITANAGQISTIIMVAVGFAVAILQLMILFILDQFFSKDFYEGKRVLAIFPLYLAGYLFLTLISVGFGFGFYWKYLEARTEAGASAEASISAVQSQLQRGASQLEQLQATLGTLATISAERAETEREQGGTCPGSGPGAGPRMRLREADAARFGFAQNFVGSRVEQVQTDIKGLTTKMNLVISNDPSTIDPRTGTRNAFLGDLNRELRLVSARFNALRTDPQLLSLRDELAQRADQTTFPSNGGTFRCPDPALSSALNGVVRAIDELPQLDPPRINPVEGSAAVVEAFRRLTTSVYSLMQLQVAPTPQELRDARERAMAEGRDPATVSAVSGLGTRDFIPLAIAIFVDFCILLVSMNRPFHAFRAFYGGVEEARTGEMGDFMQMFREVFYDQFHERPTPEQMLSPIQDIVFDHRGEYYAAVPLEFGKGDQQKVNKARYIANIMFALETRGFVTLISRAARAHEGEDPPPRTRLERMTGKRGWADLSAFARGQLKARGSEFAAAEDFRIYKFAKGKWPQIALRTVVSAHQEETRYRQAHPHARALPPAQVEDRGWLADPSDGPENRIESSEAEKPQKFIEDHSAGQSDDPHDTVKDAPSGRAENEELPYRDPEPDYARQDDPDPDDYSDPEYSQRRGEPMSSNDTTDDDTPPPKPNGRPGGTRDT